MDKWIEREIAQGLQGLVVLSLPGTPPADSILEVLDIWLSGMERAAQGWQEQLDAPRIRAAFKALFAVSQRWPAPRDLLVSMPARTPQRALPPPRMTAEERARNREKLAQMVATLNKRFGSF